MPHYNVMGLAKAALGSRCAILAADLGVKNIRVNAISSGPIKTLAASGIGDFRAYPESGTNTTPPCAETRPQDVGKTGVYFLSDMAIASPAKCITLTPATILSASSTPMPLHGGRQEE